MYNSDPPSNMHLNAWQQWAFRMEQRMQEQQDMIEQLQQELELLKQQSSKEQSAPTIHVDKIEYRFDQLKVETLEGSLQIGLSTSNPEQLPMMIEDFMMQQQDENSAAYENMKKGQHPTANQSFANQSLSNQSFANQSTSATTASQQQANKPNSKLNYLQEKFPSMRSAQSKQAAQDSEQMQHLIDSCTQLLHNELNEHFIQYIRRQSSLLQVDINDEHLKLIIEDIERQLPARIHHYAYDQNAKLKQASSEQLLQQVLSLTRKDIEGAIDQYIYQMSIQHKEEQ